MFGVKFSGFQNSWFSIRFFFGIFQTDFSQQFLEQSRFNETVLERRFESVLEKASKAGYVHWICSLDSKNYPLRRDPLEPIRLEFENSNFVCIIMHNLVTIRQSGGLRFRPNLPIKLSCSNNKCTTLLNLHMHVISMWTTRNVEMVRRGRDPQRYQQIIPAMSRSSLDSNGSGYLREGFAEFARLMTITRVIGTWAWTTQETTNCGLIAVWWDRKLIQIRILSPILIHAICGL